MFLEWWWEFYGKEKIGNVIKRGESFWVMFLSGWEMRGFYGLLEKVVLVGV